MTEKKSRRLFFALWPDDTVRQEVSRIQKSRFGATGRLIHPMDFHMTLQYLGQVDDESSACVLRSAADIMASPFRLVIDQAGYWRRPKIAWIGTDQVPRELRSLLQQLGGQLADCGFPPETRPYQPHITLVRNAAKSSPGPLDHPIAWSVNSFSLVESVSTPDPPRYHPVKTWKLK